MNNPLKILIAAFAAWMFAGLENSLFILIHRQMMFELLGPRRQRNLSQFGSPGFKRRFCWELLLADGCLVGSAIASAARAQWD